MIIHSNAKRDLRNVVSFPFLFEFKMLPVPWIQARARIIGWGRRKDGSVDGGELVAEIEGHKVPYSRRNLSEEWDHLWMQAYSDKDVERVLANVRPAVLFPSAM